MFKVLVAVKRVIDYQVKMSMNLFDEIALEEAIRLKEQGHAQTVLAVSIGPAETQETLRQALALGADEALHLLTDDSLEPLAIATLLQSVCVQQNIGLALLGKQAIDDDCNQTGQMLAGLLAWPQATFASQLHVEDAQLRVTSEVDGGLATVRVTLPAVVTADLRLNQPRFASLPNIMKAKTKPLSVVPVSALNLQLPKTCETLHVEPPAVREAGVKVNSIKELMMTLHQQGEL